MSFVIFFFKVFAIRKGAHIKAGILSAIKNVWNDANKDIVVAPALKPKIAAIILPAQVGQPINNPHVAPILPKSFDWLLLPSFNFFIIKIFIAEFSPTKKDTININTIFIGIKKIKKFSVR